MKNEHEATNQNIEPDFVCGDVNYMPAILDILEAAFVEVAQRLPNVSNERCIPIAISVFEKAMDLEIAGRIADAMEAFARSLAVAIYGDDPMDLDAQEISLNFWRETKMIRKGNFAPATEEMYDQVMTFLKGKKYQVDKEG